MDLLLRPGGTLVVGVQRTGGGLFRATALSPSYGGRAQVSRPVAAFLRSYQLDGGYTPGPLLALAALAGLAGGAGPGPVRRGGDARRRQLALGCLLFTGTAAVVLLIPDVYEFSWRYALPAVITLVPAGVLGGCAVFAGRRRRADPASTSSVRRGLVRTPAATPLTSDDQSVRRSCEAANVRAQRRSVDPPYSALSSGLSDAPDLSIQILFRTS